MRKKIVAVVGPTASGKTALSMLLAEHLPVEIVCMDALQIYKGMDIGTAKASPAEREKIPHHMLDIVAPSEPYSVAQYAKDARQAMEDIFSRNKLPLLVGGTGLYLNALSRPYDFGGSPASAQIRADYEAFLEKNGNDALFALLQERDPLSALRLHKNDSRRVIRALEVMQLTGKSISAQQMEEKGEYDILPLALLWDRQALYARINERVDAMLQEGLVEEVRQLVKSGLSEQSQSMQGIGYKEIIQYLNGESSLEETVCLIKQRTRNYAKRQLTWFRRDQRIQWMTKDEAEEKALPLVRAFLEDRWTF